MSGKIFFDTIDKVEVNGQNVCPQVAEIYKQTSGITVSTPATVTSINPAECSITIDFTGCTLGIPYVIEVHHYGAWRTFTPT